MARPEIFSINSPSVVVEVTSSDDDGTWLASGKVTFELAGGDKLTFPFVRARNQDEAVEKALEKLEQFLARFDRAAKKLREDMA